MSTRTGHGFQNGGGKERERKRSDRRRVVGRQDDQSRRRRRSRGRYSIKDRQPDGSRHQHSRARSRSLSRSRSRTRSSSQSRSSRSHGKSSGISSAGSYRHRSRSHSRSHSGYRSRSSYPYKHSRRARSRSSRSSSQSFSPSRSSSPRFRSKQEQSSRDDRERSNDVNSELSTNDALHPRRSVRKQPLMDKRWETRCTPQAALQDGGELARNTVEQRITARSSQSSSSSSHSSPSQSSNGKSQSYDEILKACERLSRENARLQDERKEVSMDRDDVRKERDEVAKERDALKTANMKLMADASAEKAALPPPPIIEDEELPCPLFECQHLKFGSSKEAFSHLTDGHKWLNYLIKGKKVARFQLGKCPYRDQDHFCSLGENRVTSGDELQEHIKLEHKYASGVRDEVYKMYKEVQDVHEYKMEHATGYASGGAWKAVRVSSLRNYVGVLFGSMDMSHIGPVIYLLHDVGRCLAHAPTGWYWNFDAMMID